MISNLASIYSTVRDAKRLGDSPHAPYQIAIERIGRGEWIRTTGLLVPNQALYQAEPRPVFLITEPLKPVTRASDHMETTATATTNIPSFRAYAEDRKYLKNVSPKNLSWFHDAWKAFGPFPEPVFASGSRLNDGLRTAITALLANGVRPVSMNGYLTFVRAYANRLQAEG